jgi:hypothetical protein
MTKNTRRSFVKRTGAATLGTALGLGLLPSLTRKLHATDSSENMPPMGVRLYLAADPQPTQYQYGGGTLTLSITQTASVAAGVCAPSILLTIVRKAVFVKTVNGSTYTGEMKRTDTVYWCCINGVPSYVPGTSPSSTQPRSAAITNSSGQSIGSMSGLGVTSSDGLNAYFTASIMLQGNSQESGWFPEVGPASYVPSCCV